MASSKKPVVIIPNLNGKKYLAECLASLLAGSKDCQIVVVDNGSTDGSQQLIRTQFPSVEQIELDKNYGFAGAVNRGIEYSLEETDYILLLNNDAVADIDWLKNLFQSAEANPKVGIITSKFLLIDRKHIDSTGDFYSSWGFPYPRGRDEIDSGQYDSRPEVFGASGGASLYRVKMLKQTGLFDEDFFAYYEDVDLSFRAQLAGWKVRFEPKAVAYHHRGLTSSKMGGFTRYHSVKNFFYLYAKNMPAKLYWKYLPKFCFAAVAMAANSIKNGQIWPLVKAYARLVVTFPATFLKRWHIQRARTVSNEYIDSILYHQVPPLQKRLVRLTRLFTRQRAS